MKYYTHLMVVCTMPTAEEAEIIEKVMLDFPEKQGIVFIEPNIDEKFGYRVLTETERIIINFNPNKNK